MNIEKSENTLVVVNYCRNCSKNLSPHAVFCNYCGGKIIKNRITVKNLLEDFNDRFLSIDGAFPKTFLALFKKPEDVIGGYINGVRKKYICFWIFRTFPINSRDLCFYSQRIFYGFYLRKHCFP